MCGAVFKCAAWLRHRLTNLRHPVRFRFAHSPRNCVGSAATLIAAAPEMFELLETIENDDGSVPPWLWDKIQEVVKRVRGTE